MEELMHKEDNHCQEIFQLTMVALDKLKVRALKITTDLELNNQSKWAWDCSEKNTQKIYLNF